MVRLEVVQVAAIPAGFVEFEGLVAKDALKLMDFDFLAIRVDDRAGVPLKVVYDLMVLCPGLHC